MVQRLAGASLKNKRPNLSDKGPFTAVIRERTPPLRKKPGHLFEVVVMENEEPVLICRRKMELPPDWERREKHFNVWKTVGNVEWVETCETLEQAWNIADERAKVLNTLADLFDADVAVSLYRRWEGEIK